jgi:frataxin-like iron-binding protein CyaY
MPFRALRRYRKKLRCCSCSNTEEVDVKVEDEVDPEVEDDVGVDVEVKEAVVDISTPNHTLRL